MCFVLLCQAQLDLAGLAPAARLVELADRGGVADASLTVATRNAAAVPTIQQILRQSHSAAGVRERVHCQHLYVSWIYQYIFPASTICMYPVYLL